MRHTCALFALSFALVAQTVVAADLQGKVVGIADGDTLTLLDAGKRQHKIRLAEVDAPEKNQAFGSRAKQALSDLCFGKQAQVSSSTADRYGRIVGTVYCDGVDANAELVRQGMTWVYVQYAKRGSPLFDLEKNARATQRGLWADAKPVPPWEWRRNKRSGMAPEAKTRSSVSAVRGNRRSSIYHLSHCPSYTDVSVGNRVEFGSEREATAAGYRRAKNCT